MYAGAITWHRFTRARTAIRNGIRVSLTGDDLKEEASYDEASLGNSTSARRLISGLAWSRHYQITQFIVLMEALRLNRREKFMARRVTWRAALRSFGLPEEKERRLWSRLSNAES